MISEPLRTWAGNHTYPAEVVHRPGGLAHLQDIVAGSRRVRAVGSRHCFNDLVDSTALVSLEAMPAVLELDEDRRTVRVDAAVRYGVLAEALHGRGWALHNLASLPHISVAGAVATATHGSGDGSSNLASAVAGLEIVGADGQLLRLTRADPELAGAVVGLGALGIVTALTLDVEPTYDVVQQVHTGLPWQVVLDDLDAVTGSADSVSLFTDWRGPLVAQVWRKHRIAGGTLPPGPWELGEAAGASAARRQVHPLPGGDPGSTTAQLGVPGPWYERLPHFRMGFVPSAGQELQSEYLVARSHAVAALSAVRRLAGLLAPVLLVSEIRTVAADDLWLSMAYRRDSLALHFTWALRPGAVAALLPVLEEALAPFSPRPHWGKLFTSAVGYPCGADFRSLVSRLDPEGTFGNAFLDRHVFSVPDERPAPVRG